jgi:GH24 family phage-related lysozyme (muramidase)
MPPIAPSAGTLVLLQRFHQDVSQDELIRRYHRTVDLLQRQLRAGAFERLNENMLGAVVSFAMDLGLGFFAQSTLRHRLNAGRFPEAVAQFGPCHNRGGRVDQVMRKRRIAEASLFCSFPS